MAARKPPKPTVGRTVWANIRKVQYLLDLTDEDLALILECSDKTLRNYDRSPEKITLETVQLFCINTGTNATELVS